MVMPGTLFYFVPIARYSWVGGTHWRNHSSKTASRFSREIPLSTSIALAKARRLRQMLHPSTPFSVYRIGKNPTAPNPVKRLDAAPASIDSPSDNQLCPWRYEGLHYRNTTPFFASDLQRSLMVDSARLQKECWSGNTKNLSESLSAEFQQGKNPAETRKAAGIRFGLPIVPLGRVGTSSRSGIHM
jgi:hypothetical protein